MSPHSATRALLTGWQPESLQLDDKAVLTCNGGAPGVAKGILLSHDNLVANAHQIVAWNHLTNTLGSRKAST